MHSARLFFFTLIATSLILAQSVSTAQPDGLVILQKMSQHYAAAKSWYIAATEQRTTWNQYSREWSKTIMVGAVSGNRYHFEGHSQAGSALHISDGKTAWDLHPEEHAYTQEAAPAHGYEPPHPIFMNEAAAQNAVSLAKNFADLAVRYKEATRLPDQTLTVDGKAISCYVVRIDSNQLKGPHSEVYTSNETLWIDKATWAVLKSVENYDTFLITAGTARIPLHGKAVTTYTITRLNAPVPDSLFRFEPPSGTHRIAKFSNKISFGPDLTGSQAPDVKLVAADGKRVALSSYRGKPVLLDFWATWCAPCIAGLPSFAKLERQAAPKGLVVLSIDEDVSAKIAKDYLVEHHYDWPNTQDEGSIGDAFSKTAIPLYVLINAKGKIVYYDMGSGEQQEAAMRTAVASLGPQFASLASSVRTQPCNAASSQ